MMRWATPQAAAASAGPQTPEPMNGRSHPRPLRSLHRDARAALRRCSRACGNPERWLRLEVVSADGSVMRHNVTGRAVGAEVPRWDVGHRSASGLPPRRLINPRRRR